MAWAAGHGHVLAGYNVERRHSSVRRGEEAEKLKPEERWEGGGSCLSPVNMGWPGL